MDVGLGGSAGYSLLLCSGFIIGLKSAFGILSTLEQFLEESTKIGLFAIYADYLENQINESKGLKVPDTGLDVIVAVQGGLLAFYPANQETEANQIYPLDLYTF